MKPHTFTGIQFLRFIAAAGVLIAHIGLIMHEKLPDLYFPFIDLGLAGVEVFFAISGFVMIISTRKIEGMVGAWKDFALRRILRIVPIYWVATTLKLAVVLLIPALAVHSEFNFTHTLASYFFIHYQDESGSFSPLHAVGWTLNYEMFFYFLFTLALFLHQRPVIMVGLIIGMLTMVGLGFDVRTDGNFVAYLQPIMLQFVIGMGIAYLCLRTAQIPLMIPVVLIALGIMGILWFRVPVNALGWEGFFLMGIPSSLLVAGVALGSPYFDQYVPRLFQQLGDSSYSLYLFHPFILAVGAIVMAKLGWPDSGLLVGLILFMLSVAASWVIYQLVELRLTNWLRRYCKPYLISHSK